MEKMTSCVCSPAVRDAIHAELKDLREDIHSLREDVTRYRGFVGGIVWTVGALVAGVQVFLNYLKG